MNIEIINSSSKKLETMFLSNQIIFSLCIIKNNMKPLATSAVLKSCLDIGTPLLKFFSGFSAQNLVFRIPALSLSIRLSLSWCSQCAALELISLGGRWGWGFAISDTRFWKEAALQRLQPSSCHQHWEWLEEGFQRRDIVRGRRREQPGGRREEGRKERREPSYLLGVLRLQAQTLGLWKQYVLDSACCPIQYLSSTSVFLGRLLL